MKAASLWITLGLVGFKPTFHGMLVLRFGIIAIGCSPHDIARKSIEALQAAMRALGRHE